MSNDKGDDIYVAGGKTEAQEERQASNHGEAVSTVLTEEADAPTDAV